MSSYNLNLAHIYKKLQLYIQKVAATYVGYSVSNTTLVMHFTKRTNKLKGFLCCYHMRLHSIIPNASIFSGFRRVAKRTNIRPAVVEINKPGNSKINANIYIPVLGEPSAAQNFWCASHAFGQASATLQTKLDIHCISELVARRTIPFFKN
eukprot:GEMP01072100.1.p1 GENE.GEMP01072100.1~~GEMP01072100.1.p1  ORF type:complete len:151 (-),score=1.78 GEMP01072100.1:222-674(-)